MNQSDYVFDITVIAGAKARSMWRKSMINWFATTLGINCWNILHATYRQIHGGRFRIERFAAQLHHMESYSQVIITLGLWIDTWQLLTDRLN